MKTQLIALSIIASVIFSSTCFARTHFGVCFKLDPELAGTFANIARDYNLTIHQAADIYSMSILEAVQVPCRFRFNQVFYLIKDDVLNSERLRTMYSNILSNARYLDPVDVKNSCQYLYYMYGPDAKSECRFIK